MQKKQIKIAAGILGGAACIGIIAGVFAGRQGQKEVELPTEGYEVEATEPVAEEEPVETYKVSDGLVETKYIHFTLPAGKENDYDFVFHDAYSDFDDDRAEFAEFTLEEPDPIHPIHEVLSLYDKKLYEDGYSGRLMDIQVSAEEPVEGTEIVGLVRSENTGEEYFLYVTYPNEESGSKLAEENSQIVASILGQDNYYVVPYDFANLDRIYDMEVQVAEIEDGEVFVIRDDGESAIIPLDRSQISALEQDAYYVMHYTGEWHDGYIAQNDLTVVNFEKSGNSPSGIVPAFPESEEEYIEEAESTETAEPAEAEKAENAEAEQTGETEQPAAPEEGTPAAETPAEEVPATETASPAEATAPAENTEAPAEAAAPAESPAP